eukprot:Seg1448.2 transcript_id=Seg1448.2/GoldUCD/mRNA.D3Y31 product="hypothetical protein" protein_id=Seg1448.2/GoldUCD/D3Y31
MWLKWRQELPLLEEIVVERCYKPKHFGGVVSATLHNFSDASEEGYGQASYLRLIDVKGNINCSLAMGKSRVPPLKQTTIPRLELTAASVSVKVGAMLRRELDMEDLKQTFWTNSQIVLGYIANETRRFRTFVANRVQIIRDHSQIEEWRYVVTKQNPADDASHGIRASNNAKNSRWFRGPEFLWKSENEWPREKAIPLPKEDDPELRKIVKVNSTAVAKNDSLLIELENRYSDWVRMKRVVALLLRFISNCKRKIKNREEKVVLTKSNNADALLTVHDVQTAENKIIRLAQEAAFKVELKRIKESFNEWRNLTC